MSLLTLCVNVLIGILANTRKTHFQTSHPHHRLIWCSYMCNIYVTYLNMYLLFVCHFVYNQMINPLYPMPFLWLVSPYTLHFLGHK